MPAINKQGKQAFKIKERELSTAYFDLALIYLKHHESEIRAENGKKKVARGKTSGYFLFAACAAEKEFFILLLRCAKYVNAFAFLKENIAFRKGLRDSLWRIDELRDAPVERKAHVAERNFFICERTWFVCERNFYFRKAKRCFIKARK